jgi:hypothetical protein
MPKRRFEVKNSNFGFVSYFGIRISNFWNVFGMTILVGNEWEFSERKLPGEGYSLRRVGGINLHILIRKIGCPHPMESWAFA